MVRFILQVIKEASINKDVKIGKGLLVYVGFYKNEKQTDLDWALRKTLSMCLWEDENDGRPWRKGISEIGGDVVFVYDKNIYAKTSGDRPEFDDCMDDKAAKETYDKLVLKAKQTYKMDKVHVVQFGEKANICLINDGPITIDVDSFNKK